MQKRNCSCTAGPRKTGWDRNDLLLKELAKLRKLEMLYLFGTKVTKAGVDELKKALPKCYIQY